MKGKTAAGDVQKTYDSVLSMRFTVFNKGQQGYLLPFVEDGTVTLIGATTENPYFEVNGALISPIHYFELKPLEKEDIKTLLHRALGGYGKGMEPIVQWRMKRHWSLLMYQAGMPAAH